MAKFEKVWCSQCGEEFGPRDSGFSHCDQHLQHETLDALRARSANADLQALRELGRRARHLYN